MTVHTISAEDIPGFFSDAPKGLIRPDGKLTTDGALGLTGDGHALYDDAGIGREGVHAPFLRAVENKHLVIATILGQSPLYGARLQDGIEKVLASLPEEGRRFISNETLMRIVHRSVCSFIFCSYQYDELDTTEGSSFPAYSLHHYGQWLGRGSEEYFGETRSDLIEGSTELIFSLLIMLFQNADFRKLSMSARAHLHKFKTEAISKGGR